MSPTESTSGGSSSGFALTDLASQLYSRSEAAKGSRSATPSPPMFGSQTKGTAKVKSQSANNSGFSGTILGALSAPSNTGQKTLLGQ